MLTRLTTRLSIFALAISVPLVGGCHWWGSPGARLEARSITTGAVLKPSYPTSVFLAIDESTGDIYLTDLPVNRLADPADELDGLSGTIVHLHLFMVPKGGMTPSDPTACTASVREIVIADGAIGVYGGGGFIDSTGFEKPGIRASIADVSLRLLQQTPDFADRLGPTKLSGSLTAVNDERTARAIAGRVQALGLKVPHVPMPVEPSKAESKSEPAKNADKAPAKRAK
jgi:hypothetical protein